MSKIAGMNAATLKLNLICLNDLMGLSHRRAFIQATGMGGPEFVRYLTGEKLPPKAKVRLIEVFFGLPPNAFIDEKPLTEPLVDIAKAALTRFRRQAPPSIAA